MRPDYPNSLSQQEQWRDYRAPENAGTYEKEFPLGAAGPAWEAADVTDSIYYDGKTTNMALRKLDELAKADKPFFFGVGFFFVTLVPFLGITGIFFLALGLTLGDGLEGLFLGDV